MQEYRARIRKGFRIGIIPILIPRHQALLSFVTYDCVVDVVNTTLGILKDLQKLVRQRKACGTNKLVQNTSQMTKLVLLC